MDYFSHREALHEHVSAVAIAEFLLSLNLDLARLMVVVSDVCVGQTPPAAALVHVGAVLSDGVCAALSLAGVETLRCLARLAGGQGQAVHPAVS